MDLWKILVLGTLRLIFHHKGRKETQSCTNLLFRDVKYIVEVILTFGIFFAPVFYEAKMFGKWETILL